MTGPAPLSWSEQRAWLRTRLQQQPPADISPDEVAAHFESMPEHYWARVNEPDLLWGLETIHGFFRQIASPNVPSTLPLVRWRQAPEQNQTRVMICTWDRQGLLAKAAAAFSAVRLNIREADVFTRLDHVALDVFTVTEFDGPRAISPTRLEEMTFLLDGALSDPPRFASVWACSRHRLLAAPNPWTARITFDNQSSPSSTLLCLEAPDRLGLLYDVLETIANQGLCVTSARIETEQDCAHDVIHITDALGRKVGDPGRLEDLRCCLESALNIAE